MSEEKRDKYDIELPQSIIESLARFLVPEMKKYYAERAKKHETKTKKNSKRREPRH